jgi:hypothetical protein
VAQLLAGGGVHRAGAAQRGVFDAVLAGAGIKVVKIPPGTCGHWTAPTSQPRSPT